MKQYFARVTMTFLESYILQKQYIKENLFIYLFYNNI